MKISIKKLYECLYILMMINNWCGEFLIISNIYSFIKPIVLGISITIFLQVAVRKHYSVVEFFTVLFLFFIGGYTAYVTESKWIFYLIILIVFSKHIDVDRLLLVTYRCLSVFLLFIIVIFVIQFIQAPYMLKTVTYGHVVRYDMNFVSPNEAPRYWIYWALLSECLDLNGQLPSSILKRVATIFGTVFFYVFTHSDALLLVVGILIFRYLGRYRRWVRFVEILGGYSFLALWSMSIFILKLNETKFFTLINDFCSGRLSLGIAAFRMYGVTFFGRYPLEFYHWVNAGESDAFRLFVDNAYHMIMIQHGIIYLLIISYIFIKTSKKCSYGENLCFIVYSAFALAENVIFSPTAIFPVLIAANVCWGKRREK